MSVPALQFSDDQAEAHDRVAEMLRGVGVDIDESHLTPRAEGQAGRVLAVIGKAGSGKTMLLAKLYEALEEAGLEVGDLHLCHGYYPSPGAKTEFIYSYVAVTDLPDSASGLGGLMHEGEDIRVHLVSFDRAMALAESGEIGNAPLILSLQWLALNRERLRAGA